MTTEEHPPWTQDQLAGHLRDTCGVKPGDILMIHSSAAKVGKVEGGVIAMLKAVKQAVTPEGTVLMPVFSNPRPDGVFSMKRTPSRVGLLTEALRRNKEAVRSRHPTHSWSAWGKRAVELTAGHDKTTATGPGCPMQKAAEAGADVLMIGCIMNTCTLVHLAESLAHAPWLGKVWYPGYEEGLELTIVDLDGSRHPFVIKDSPGDGNGFVKVQKEMERRGQIARGKFGDAVVLKFSAADGMSTATEMLRADMTATLCDHPRCYVCPKSRKIVEELKQGGK